MFVFLEACCSASTAGTDSTQHLSSTSDLGAELDRRHSLSFHRHLAKWCQQTPLLCRRTRSLWFARFHAPRKRFPQRLAPCATVSCAAQGDDDPTRACEEAARAVGVHARSPVVKEVAAAGGPAPTPPCWTYAPAAAPPPASPLPPSPTQARRRWWPPLAEGDTAAADPSVDGAAPRFRSRGSKDGRSRHAPAPPRAAARRRTEATGGPPPPASPRGWRQRGWRRDVTHALCVV